MEHGATATLFILLIDGWQERGVEMTPLETREKWEDWCFGKRLCLSQRQFRSHWCFFPHCYTLSNDYTLSGSR